jgi:hypothetical protein
MAKKTNQNVDELSLKKKAQTIARAILDSGEFDRAAWLSKVRATPSMSPLKINVPFWGDTYIRALTAGEATNLADKSEKGLKLDEKYGNARLIAAMVCDPDGVALFDKDSEEDLTFLKSQRPSISAKILSAITKHNGWDVDVTKND